MTTPTYSSFLVTIYFDEKWDIFVFHTCNGLAKKRTYRKSMRLMIEFFCNLAKRWNTVGDSELENDPVLFGQPTNQSINQSMSASIWANAVTLSYSTVLPIDAVELTTLSTQHSAAYSTRSTASTSETEQEIGWDERQYPLLFHHHSMITTNPSTVETKD